jgi:phage-related protein
MYNIKTFNFKLGVICVLILFFILIICKNITNTIIEGFGAGDITKIADKVGNIAEDAGKIPGKITEIGSKISNATTGITNMISQKISGIEERVEQKVQNKIDVVKDTIKKDLIDPIKDEVRDAKNQIKDIFAQLKGIPQLIIDKIEKKVEWLIKKIKRFGENIGELIKGGIVTPFITLFEALGNMFVMIGDIALKVIDKIKSLPNCSILYMLQSVFAVIDKVYKGILPGFLRDIMSTIYKYTLKIPLETISDWLRLTEWWDKCLSFNVDEEVNSIRDKFKEVGPAFRNSFGKMDFKDLIDFS